MPAAVAIPLITAGASAGASLAAGKMGSSAANSAAKAQGASNADALAFEKQKDAEDRAQFDRTQRANYDQYLMKYNAAKQLGSEYGLNLPDAKPYVSLDGGQPGQPAQGQPQGSDPAAFIRQYQAQHNPTEGPSGILNAMKQAGFNVAPYMYGDKQSGNEISLNGEKYKVISGENGPTPGWYQAGMDDSAPGARSPISGYMAAGGGMAQPQAGTFKLKSINAFL
jgi:hypothetical protein